MTSHAVCNPPNFERFMHFTCTSVFLIHCQSGIIQSIIPALNQTSPDDHLDSDDYARRVRAVTDFRSRGHCLRSWYTGWLVAIKAGK